MNTKPTKDQRLKTKS